MVLLRTIVPKKTIVVGVVDVLRHGTMGTRTRTVRYVHAIQRTIDRYTASESYYRAILVVVHYQTEYTVRVVHYSSNKKKIKSAAPQSDAGSNCRSRVQSFPRNGRFVRFVLEYRSVRIRYTSTTYVFVRYVRYPHYLLSTSAASSSC